MTLGPRSMLNAMSIDVEEHFQVSGFEGVVPRGAWDSMPSRVDRNTRLLLDLLDEAGVRATFFVLGWIAERHPSLVRDVASRGHEIGCHGWAHRLIYDQDPADFRNETTRARRILQDASGQAVDGYRAASFSIDRRSLWALDALIEAGFRYDSSIFPIHHDRYGVPGAPRRIHRVVAPGGGTLTEVPPSAIRVAGRHVPVAGGGYLRLYPEAVTSWAIRRLHREGIGAVVYVHPWEFDPDQPRIDAPPLRRFRHYVGIPSLARKLRSLASRFRFGTVAELVETASGLDTVEAGRREAEGARA